MVVFGENMCLKYIHDVLGIFHAHLCCWLYLWTSFMFNPTF